MERSIERIQRFTAISPVLVQNRDAQYNLPSGASLRRLSIVTVARILTLRELLTPAMKQAAAENLEVVRQSGIDAPVLDPDNIEITWPLPLEVPGEGEEWGSALSTAQTAEG